VKVTESANNTCATLSVLEVSAPAEGNSGGMQIRKNHPSARAKHPRQLFNCATEVLNMFESQGANHQVEGGGLER
jgi:hypothetical protein